MQPRMDDFEEIVSIVKLEILLGLAYAARDSGEPGSFTKSRMNAWLGPHWILTSTPSGIELYMEDSTLVYSGKFSAFTGSMCATYLITEMNKQSAEYRSLVRGMALDFGRLLSTEIVPELPPHRIQSDVQGFFRAYRHQLVQLGGSGPPH
jgi:hypothetical protein